MNKFNREDSYLISVFLFYILEKVSKGNHISIIFTEYPNLFFWKQFLKKTKISFILIETIELKELQKIIEIILKPIVNNDKTNCILIPCVSVILFNFSCIKQFEKNFGETFSSIYFDFIVFDQLNNKERILKEKLSFNSFINLENKTIIYENELNDGIQLFLP